jgi:MerR family transcriptional regulator, light-induced transcriptional regulator
MCCIVRKMSETGVLRIGELSRRSGVSPELLRAWERRYRLLRPTRSSGGLRLYSLDDLERVRAMQQHLADGVAAAEAAALASSTAEQRADAPLAPASARADLAAALAGFDETRAHEIFDMLLADRTLDSALSEVVVPYLEELGERWARNEASVAQEHFASGFLRGRLLGLARGWGRGLGPCVVLACAPGEQHELGLIAFGLALRAHGWRILYLGPDTPIATIGDAARACEPAFIVVSSFSAERFRESAAELRRLAKSYRLCLGGAGAAEQRLGVDALRLTDDVIASADRLTDLARAAGAP